MVDSNDLKRGILLELDGAPWQVLDVSFQSPSARGASTLAKVKIKNLKTGAVLAKTFRGGEKLETADYERRAVQYLYRAADDFHFMDSESYEQFELDKETLGDAAGYLVDGMEVSSFAYNGAVISVELPTVVELEVVECPPAIKNATAQAQLKPATLETGLQIQVPPYLTSGERVKVDTRDGRFIERAKK